MLSPGDIMEGWEGAETEKQFGAPESEESHPPLFSLKPGTFLLPEVLCILLAVLLSCDLL